MGEIRSYRCNACDHDFSRREGRGFAIQMLYCERCGSSRQIPAVDDKPASITCECGGSIHENARPRCPACNSSDIGDDTGPFSFGVIKWD